jgi:hypothetical protein
MHVAACGMAGYPRVGREVCDGGVADGQSEGRDACRQGSGDGELHVEMILGVDVAMRATSWMTKLQR